MLNLRGAVKHGLRALRSSRYIEPMPSTLVVTDLVGLGGRKFVCKGYKVGPSGELRCAKKVPVGKGTHASAISRRSKVGARASKGGFVAGLGGQCRTAKGRFKKCR